MRALDAKGLGGDALQRRARLQLAAERLLGSPPSSGPATAGAGSTSAGSAGAGSAGAGASASGAVSADADAGAARRRHKGTKPRPSTGNIFSRLSPGPDQVRGYQQMVNAKGTIVVRSAKDVSLPVDAGTRALAAHGGKPFFRDATVNGIHLRVLAESLGKGHAVQFAQPLTEVDSLLCAPAADPRAARRRRHRTRRRCSGGSSRAPPCSRSSDSPKPPSTSPLTRDLSGRIEPSGDDELGRLASSFNAMLDALEHSMNALDASVHAQRQLVADASHELRTPVTSLRTNIEILQQQGQDMDPEEQPPAAQRRGRADRGADAADERPHRPRPRRGTARRRRGAAPGPARRRGHRPRAPTRALDAAAGAARAGDRHRRARATRARRRQPDRQRHQVQPARRARRDQPARRRADRARPRARHLQRRSAAHLRSLLPRRRGARATRLRARPSDRAAGRQPAAAAASPPRTRQAAAR